MKKKINLLMTLAIIFCISMTINSCGFSSTPSSKALELIGYMQDQDYSSYVEELYLAPDDDITKEDLLMIFEEKGNEVFEEYKGIDSYEVVNEIFAEDGKSATVIVNILYGDGKTREQAIKLIMDDNGEWKGLMK